MRAASQFPLLQLSLFRIRTFRAAVSGSFFTRLGIGGVPFLLPLLYQIGLGFTPIQSGLLIMPQAIGAMSIKAVLRRIAGALRLSRRADLQHHHPRRAAGPVSPPSAGTRRSGSSCCWPSCYGAFTSLQYTSMNTLVYADIAEQDASSASSIASTMQQMSISFGVADGGADHRVLCPHGTRVCSQEMTHGIHLAVPLSRRTDHRFHAGLRRA